jgi:hypothetical protein
MRFGVVTLKARLWWLGVLFVAFAVPLQVYAQNPYPSLLPYGIIALIAVVEWAFPRSATGEAGPPAGAIRPIVVIYSAMVALSAGWQAMLGLIDVGTATSGVVIFLLPVAWYWYFRRPGTGREVRAVLSGIAVAGLVVGLYFAYDSYSKIALGRVTTYANAAFQYSVARSGLGEAEANTQRILANSRAFGLLETHSVSGAWIILGAFAALAILPARRKLLRLATLLAAGGLLLLGLNFTAIVAFATIAFVLEFGGAVMLQARFSIRTALRAISLPFLVTAIAAIALALAGAEMTEFILGNLSFQRELALGTSGRGSYMDLVGMKARDYVLHIDDMPFTLLFGDGYGTYGSLKGGDIGLIETLERLGLPLFAAVFVGVVALIRAGLRQIAARRTRDHAPAQATVAFCVAVLMLVLIMDIHYSIWYAKSILPVVFFALALCERTFDRERRARLPLAATQGVE